MGTDVYWAVKCPICQAENPGRGGVCSACGSNMSSRGGADIVLHKDGSLDHAGDSRWKVGGGAAGTAALIGLAKFKALAFLLLKLYWVFSLIRLTTFGGWAAVAGMAGIAFLVAGSLFRFRRRIHI